MRPFAEHRRILSDLACHAAQGDPANLKLCARGEWNDRLLIETVLSRLTLVSHFKKVMPPRLGVFRGASGMHHGRVERAGAVAWLAVDKDGFVSLSIAEFSL